MGLILFNKNAGNKVIEIEKTYINQSEEASIRKREIESSAAKVLTEMITDLQLQVENLNIFIDRDVAVITGLACNQTTREKVVLVVGNSKGIAAVEDYMTVENEAPVAQFYTVVSGDTLRTIAKMYYGNDREYETLFDANKPMLNHPQKIYQGQVLRIPA